MIVHVPITRAYVQYIAHRHMQRTDEGLKYNVPHQSIVWEHGPLHYKIGVTCVYNGHGFCTLL